MQKRDITKRKKTLEKLRVAIAPVLKELMKGETSIILDLGDAMTPLQFQRQIGSLYQRLNELADNKALTADDFDIYANMAGYRVKTLNEYEVELVRQFAPNEAGDALMDELYYKGKGRANSKYLRERFKGLVDGLRSQVVDTAFFEKPVKKRTEEKDISNVSINNDVDLDSLIGDDIDYSDLFGD